MTQQDLDRQVARATGDTLCEIRRLGFSIADPVDVDFDPEPSDPVDKYLDWDELERIEPPRPYRRRRLVTV